MPSACHSRRRRRLCLPAVHPRRWRGPEPAGRRHGDHVRHGCAQCLSRAAVDELSVSLVAGGIGEHQWARIGSTAAVRPPNWCWHSFLHWPCLPVSQPQTGTHRWTSRRRRALTAWGRPRRLGGSRRRAALKVPATESLLAAATASPASAWTLCHPKPLDLGAGAAPCDQRHRGGAGGGCVGRQGCTGGPVHHRRWVVGAGRRVACRAAGQHAGRHAGPVKLETKQAAGHTLRLLRSRLCQ